MKKIEAFKHRILGILICSLAFLPVALSGADRFQIELYGGISFVDPKDLNLFSKAEQQYNDIYFIERLRQYNGFFVNDFPEIREMIPAGLRFRYHASEKISFSLAIEGFTQKTEATLEGSFGYSSTFSENYTKKYDPFQLRLSGYALLGGVQYRIPVGSKTDIAIGAAAGWAKADFDFSSNWFYTTSYEEPSVSYYSVEGGNLEGDGSGNGFMAQGMLRLNRMLGKRVGLFIESAYTYCRMKSLDGGGREARTGIPGDQTWEGTWGIKKEEIRVPWGDKTVSVPTNYWEGWTAGQRDRDFVLDLSGFRLVLGIVFRL